ncbi:hypothetical protein T459_09162 [Capsicum annuum]|uniref:RNase H type-1 domain-containing protein n=1 Tax=Capsicum annuum TaxID=4072 RepID=A0A2G2ZYK7_CAPAN|nr:hypothetical protein FXO37_16674 [Capsicum annuum]PHT87056.1 hypothetical protein T459_09162 [Capsicum annuum]
MRPKNIIKSVIWSKPMHEMIKFNTDGSYLWNNRKARIEGIARNCEGKFIFAFVVLVIARYHNVAEVMAAKYVVEWMSDHGHRKGIIEMDSMIMGIVKDINLRITDADMSFAHYLHEGNMVVDCLAKIATTIEYLTHFHRYDDLPTNAKISFMLDEWQLPSFRIRYNKANFVVS